MVGENTLRMYVFTPFELPLKKCAVILALKGLRCIQELYKQRWYRVRQTSFDGCRFLYGKMEENKMELVNVLENEHLSMLNHSCAHMMAQAVKRLYPNAKFWVGPVI